MDLFYYKVRGRLLMELINHEDDALQTFTRSTGLPVTNCGLFVGRGDEFFLGASPDGIIESQDEDALNLEGRFIAKEAGKKKSKVPFLHVDRHTDQISLKRNHNYYYQVQGHLHIVPFNDSGG